MSILFFIFVWINLLLYVETGYYQCPNYAALNQQPQKRNKKCVEKIPFQCNLLMTNPKKVINRYKNQRENYVESKPFGSVCLKCSLCLAIAKEMDNIFRDIVDNNKQTKQTIVVDLLQESVNSLCANGFENYDLRKFKQLQVVTDDFTCNTHVRTKMDGQWTEKLREMCAMYSDHMIVQSLLNDYLRETNNISNYLCNNTGVFRDCSSLNFKNASEENYAETMCELAVK